MMILVPFKTSFHIHYLHKTSARRAYLAYGKAVGKQAQAELTREIAFPEQALDA
jgi:hypothetical protein